MAFVKDTLRSLRIKALGYVGDIQSDSRFGPTDAVPENSLCDQFINDGLNDMTTDWLGIDDCWRTMTTVGQRAYSLPDGFRLCRTVLYNGVPMREAALEELDWYSPGNSWPDRFAIWMSGGKILLGPQPPYQSYELKMFYWRPPQTLVKDDDQPEIPNEYRAGLAYYAAAQMALGDGELNLHGTLMKQYGVYQRRFTEWCDGRSSQNHQVRNLTEGFGVPWGWR